MSRAKALENGAILALLTFFVLISVLSVRGRTVTTDEDRHYLYGTRILNGISFRFDDSKMPFSAWNALPAKVASYLPEGKLSHALSGFLVARFMTILFSLLVALLVFLWTRSLYGFIPALFSLALYGFDPNIIAHSQLVTTDIYAAGTIFFAFYCLWRFARQRSWANGLLCALALGLSQIAKYTAVALFPLFLACLLLYDLPSLTEAVRLHGSGAGKNFILKYLIYLVGAIITSILIINVAFLFRQTFTRFGDYQFKSDMFQKVQSNFPVLNNLPVPTPYPYLEGLDWVMQRERTGDGYGNIYFMGQIRHGQGFSGYYFVATLLKEPIATQMIVMAALCIYALEKIRRRRFLTDDLFLLAPIAFFAIYFNFFYNAQMGLRFYLVIFPFSYVFAGSLFTGWQKFSRVQKTVLLASFAYLVVSVFSYYPYYLPYFNELVWDRTQAYKYLTDSNLDWGQSKNEYKQYLDEHPEAAIAPGNVKAGTFVVGVNNLVGVTGDPQKYAWLRENFEPTATIAYSYLIYNISPDDVVKVCETTSYCNK